MVKNKIMIIDDNKEFLEELSEALRASGYEIVAVDDPTLTLGIVASEKPDALLVDIKMPGKSGFVLANELMDLPELEGIPVIAMSGFYKAVDSAFMDICGIKDYLKKPFRPEDAIAKIKEVTRERRYNRKEKYDGRYKKRSHKVAQSGARA